MNAVPARACSAGIALLALLAWWPVGAYWQSDDFLALTYASDPARALADFAGNQYGTPALVWFYRPLITLSFALDAQLGGAEPFVAHLSNAIAHAISTWLLVQIGRRLLGDANGLRLGLLWAVWPTHAGSVLWAVGRVDSHTTVWILLTLLCTLRWLDRGRGLLPALAAFVPALLSKELAFVVPALAGLLGFATAPPGRRVRQAWHAARPFLAVFAVYLAWRYLVLGRLVGGYQDARWSLLPSLAGLGTWTARLANPVLDAGVHRAVGLLAFGVWPLALLVALRRRRGATVLLLLLGFTVCALPTAPFWAETAEIKNVRYFYLPAACLLGLVALGGRWPTLLALVGAVVAFAHTRVHYHAAHTHAAHAHGALRQADAQLPPGPLLVQGLPRENAARDVLMFHLFIDRLLLPPFGSGRSVLALRPLVQRPGVLTLPNGIGAGIDGYHALALADDGTVVPLVPPALPPLAVESERILHLSSQAMWDLHRGRTTLSLRFPDSRSSHYRLTLFTPGGYLTCVLPNEAPAQPYGEVSVKALLTLGRYATAGDDAVMALALGVPVALDVSADYPLLAESGEITGADPHTFAPHARAAHYVTLRFDRDYCDWMAGKVGDRKP